MPRDPEHIFFLYLRSREHKSLMIDWAVELLCEGKGGKFTTLLAGADDEDDREVVHLFRKAAIENNVALPEPEKSLNWEERYICRAITKEWISPTDGLNHLYEVWIKSNYDPRFLRWVYLSESIDLIKSGYGPLEPFGHMTLKTIDQSILETARQLSSANMELTAPE